MRTLNNLWTLPLTLALVMIVSAPASAMIEGISGTSFDFTARDGYLSTADGSSVYFWGLSNDNGSSVVQYPAPTLILQQGDTITITLKSALAEPTSLIFPGQKVTASGGIAGLLTQEAPADGVTTVTYTFVAEEPGTYLYQSGTHPELQVEMGIIGAIIIRPAGFDPMAPRAYAHEDSSYDKEELFLMTEMDPRIHEWVRLYGADSLYADTDFLTDYVANLWFLNGRNAPDTMVMANVLWLPKQPYNCMPMIEPGEKLLMRLVSGGRDLHPFHHHGNHSTIIARNGRLASSAPGTGADLSQAVFTVRSVPGQTVDTIFDWTGERLGWDIYGTDAAHAHDCVDTTGDGFDDTTHEYCADHGKPIPVELPQELTLTYGGFYSGSPFLGNAESLPVGEGGMNPSSGYVYMWHSHNEKEMVNYDIFPGGMMTMLIVVPPGTPMSPMMQ